MIAGEGIVGEGYNSFRRILTTETGEWVHVDSLPINGLTLPLRFDHNISMVTTESFLIDNIVFETGIIPGSVPEPATWLMMIAGFGLVGLAMRRRARMRVTYA
jgi:hypothetical protein